MPFARILIAGSSWHPKCNLIHTKFKLYILGIPLCYLTCVNLPSLISLGELSAKFVPAQTSIRLQASPSDKTVYMVSTCISQKGWVFMHSFNHTHFCMHSTWVNHFWSTFFKQMCFLYTLTPVDHPMCI